MRHLIHRIISGLVYVALVIGAIQLDFTFFMLVAGLGTILITEYGKVAKVKTVRLLLYFLILIVSLGALYKSGESKILEPLTIFILGSAIVAHFFLLEKLALGKPITNQKRYGIFYKAHGLISITLIGLVQGYFDPVVTLYFFVTIWISDSGAFAVGNMIRGKKLMPSISPKKTISGLIGGLFFAGITGYIMSLYSEVFTTIQWIIFGVTIALISAAGDLIESKFKREAGLKDSGQIMPGHGGMFDRLDGVIFAAPWATIIFKLMNYVS